MSNFFNYVRAFVHTLFEAPSLEEEDNSKTQKPTHTPQISEENNESSDKPKNKPARVLLKEATALKREKKYTEACAKLEEARLADDGEELMLKELLRLPMYLQLANKNDEGWRILNELGMKHVDLLSQAEIANQMRVFLQKEKKYSEALLHSISYMCKRIEHDREMVQEIEQMADGITDAIEDLSSESALLKEFSDKFDEGREVFAHTSKGNPIRDSAYNMLAEGIEDATSQNSVSKAILPLLKKLKETDKSDELSAQISAYLQSSKQYDIFEYRGIIQSILTEE